MDESKLIKRLQQNINSKSVEIKPNEVEHEAPKSNVKPKLNHYEMVNHPKHYNNYDIEVVDMMEKIWGTKATMEWCKMTAYKYRMRMGTKPGNDNSNDSMKDKLLEDFNKEQWYINKYEELKSKFDIGDTCEGKPLGTY